MRPETFSLSSKLEAIEKESASLKSQVESLKAQLTSSEKKVMILLQRAQGISGCSLQELEAAIENVDGDTNLRLSNTLSEIKNLRDQLQEVTARCEHYKVLA